jgi:hypothetical protein
MATKRNYKNNLKKSFCKDPQDLELTYLAQGIVYWLNGKRLEVRYFA